MCLSSALLDAAQVQASCGALRFGWAAGNITQTCVKGEASLALVLTGHFAAQKTREAWGSLEKQ